MTFTRDLQFGSYGKDVYNLQRALEILCIANFTPTGFFGPVTQRAVVAFQEKHNITPAVGYFGPITRSIMISELSKMNREILHAVAVSHLGTDFTPDELVPDEVSCAFAVNTLHRKAFGVEIGGGASTYLLYDALRKSTSFIGVDSPLPGDIIISPTGYSRNGSNGILKSGHAGIMGINNEIMSNNSFNGLFDKHYTLSTWIDRYGTLGGYPIWFFRRL